MGRRSKLALAALSPLLVHCGSKDDVSPTAIATDGGSPAPLVDAGSAKADAAITVDTAGPMTCKTDADCSEAQTCSSGICGLAHCTAAAVGNLPPLGQMYAIAPVRQLVLANAADPLAISYDGSPFTIVGNGTFHPPAASIAMAAGRFVAATNAGLATAQAGVTGISLRAGPNQTSGSSIPLSFAPIALAARDFNADGIDEIVALGAAGDIAMCSALTSTCKVGTLGGTGVDIAAGDALHDGVIRAVAFTKNTAGVPTLSVWSPTVSVDKAEVGTITPTLSHLSMGDIDGDGHDDIIGLEDRGYLGFVSDELHLYGFTASMLTDKGSLAVNADSVDLAVGTFDGSKGGQVTLLRANSVVDEYTGTTFATLADTSTATLDDVQNATQLAIADVRGLSAMGTLEGAPTLVEGNPTPIFAAIFPPFSAANSSGVSDVVLTSTSTTSDMTSQTLSLRAAATIGYEESVPDVAKASVSARIEGTLAATASDQETLTLAETFSMFARTTAPLDDAAVLVAGTCFQAYRYHVTDPNKLLGAGVDGTSMAVLAPVGAERSVWSLTRYNAVAQAIGGLPLLPTTYRAGDPATYPANPGTLSGEPISADDLVFPQLDSYEVTDSARLDLHFTLSDTKVNMLAATATATLTGAVTVGGVMGGEELAISLNGTESITLGTQTDLAFDIPALMTGTLTTYSFTPYLYKEHYASKSGGAIDSGLYVLGFSVGH